MAKTNDRIDMRGIVMSDKKQGGQPSEYRKLLGFNVVINDKIEAGTMYLVGNKAFDIRLSKEERVKYLVKMINLKV